MDYRRLLQIALPAMVENFLQMAMGLVDAYLVSFLGLVVISGVSIASNVLSVFQAVFLALGAATSATLARSFGKGEHERLAIQATEALKLAMLTGFFFGILSLFWGKTFLVLLGTETEVAQAGGKYLFLVGGASFLMGLILILGAIFRAIGHNKLPVYVSLFGNMLNVFFSVIAVFGLRMGIEGVAIGTILSRVISCGILLHCLPFQLTKINWGFDRELLALALSSAGERLMMRAGDVVVVSLIVGLGTPIVAGNAIGESLTQLNYLPVSGIATASLILISQAIGQGENQRVKEIVKGSYYLSILVMATVAFLNFLFGGALSRLYSQDQVVIAASQLVILFSLLGTPATVGTLIYTAVWQGAGNAQLPFLATSIGMWGIRIGLGYLLTVVFSLGLAGVWLATLLDNLFRWFFLATFFQKRQRSE